MPMRSVFSVGCLITLFLSCIHPVSGMDGTDCINNLTTIALEEALTENTMERRTYVLCTDVVYNVGVLDVDGRIFDGFFPLAVKGNATVRCGDDGQRDNNCRVFYGDVGAVLAPFQANNLDPIDFGSGEGVVIEGLTFDSLLRAPVFMDQVYGNIDFINCAFLVRLSLSLSLSLFLCTWCVCVWLTCVNAPGLLWTELLWDPAIHLPLFSD